MENITYGREAAPTASRPENARRDSKPSSLTPSFETPQSRCPLARLAVQRRIGSTDYAAHIIASRFRMSPVVAGKIVESIGIGGAA